MDNGNKSPKPRSVRFSRDIDEQVIEDYQQKVNEGKVNTFSQYMDLVMQDYLNHHSHTNEDYTQANEALELPGELEADYERKYDQNKVNSREDYLRTLFKYAKKWFWK